MIRMTAADIDVCFTAVGKGRKRGEGKHLYFSYYG
jgi:hypothetical protein